jgi:hypothetical protein
MVDGGTGRKWRRFAADPRLVAGKEERRQWVAALTARHMENTRLLVTGCHYYPLRGTEFWCLYTPDSGLACAAQSQSKLARESRWLQAANPFPGFATVPNHISLPISPERDMSLSREFASFVAGLRYEDLPPEVVDRAKGVTLQALTSALIGRNMPASYVLRRLERCARNACASCSACG